MNFLFLWFLFFWVKEKRNVLLLSDLKDIHTQGKAKCFVIVLSKSCFERITKWLTEMV